MQAHELRDKKLPAPSRFAEAKIYSSFLGEIDLRVGPPQRRKPSQVATSAD
jgi:hypothetical protein